MLKTHRLLNFNEGGALTLVFINQLTQLQSCHLYYKKQIKTQDEEIGKFG